MNEGLDPVLRLTRFSYGAAQTLGYMVMGAQSPDPQLIYTLEDPWWDNRVGESCIPDGRYLCVPRFFHRGGYDAIEITGVPGRSTILFHKGNTANNVTGCIVLGSSIGVLSGLVAVLASSAAWARFMAEYNRPFTLDIAPLWPLAGAKQTGSAS